MHCFLKVEAFLQASWYQRCGLPELSGDELRFGTGIFLLHLREARNSSERYCLLSALKIAQYLGFQLPATICLGYSVRVAHLQEEMRFDLTQWIGELRLILEGLEILFVLLL